MRYIFDLQKLETNSLKGHFVASRHRRKKRLLQSKYYFCISIGHWRNNIFWNFFVLRFKCKKIADTAQIRAVKKVTNVFSYRLAKWRAKFSLKLEMFSWGYWGKHPLKWLRDWLLQPSLPVKPPAPYCICSWRKNLEAWSDSYLRHHIWEKKSLNDALLALVRFISLYSRLWEYFAKSSFANLRQIHAWRRYT